MQVHVWHENSLLRLAVEAENPKLFEILPVVEYHCIYVVSCYTIDCKITTTHLPQPLTYKIDEALPTKELSLCRNAIIWSNEISNSK